MNGFNFILFTFEVLISWVWQHPHEYKHAHRAHHSGHTHTHADTTPWPSPSDEPKFALPMVLCARAISQPRRFPLNSHNFIKEEWEERGGAEEKKKQKKKRKKRERKSSVFLITSPWGFQLRRWGRSKQFCLSCFCCLALSFRGRFCFELSSSLFLIFCWEIEGVINVDPLPTYSPLFAPLYSVLGRFPLVINSQQN